MMKKVLFVCLALALMVSPAVMLAAPVAAGLAVDIDIKPGSDPNSINPNGNGVIAVAILTTFVFDATEVDPTTVIFAGAAPLRSAVEDVDYDGDLDLVLHFKTKDTGIAGGDSDATLIGETYGGLYFEGTDSVRVKG